MMSDASNFVIAKSRIDVLMEEYGRISGMINSFKGRQSEIKQEIEVWMRQNNLETVTTAGGKVYFTSGTTMESVRAKELKEERPVIWETLVNDGYIKITERAGYLVIRFNKNDNT